MEKKFLDIQLNSMLIVNGSREINGINNKRPLFEVMSSIKVPSTSCLGLGQSITLTGYSRVFT